MPTAPTTPSLPQVSFVNLYSEDPWRKRQRVRIQQACSECRRQKIKCDGQKPCKSCKKSDRNCVYNSSSGTSSPSTKEDQQLNDDSTSMNSTNAESNATLDQQQEYGSSQSNSPSHSHSPHPYSKHQTVGRHQSKDGNSSIKQEPSDHVKPSPLRKDSRQDRKNHDSDSKSKVHIKDIGKYGVPLDEWQKLDDSTTQKS
ncbi:hypothetical protein BGZ76_006955, partial [Entomortierella beljakovae]